MRRVTLTALAVLAALAALVQVARADDLQTLMAAGQTSYRAGDLARAWATFRQAAALAPTSAKVALWLGAVSAARGDQAAAEQWFRKALHRQPSLVEESCAIQWLDRLGVAAPRARWHLGTPDDYATFILAANPRLATAEARWLGAGLVSTAVRYGIDPRLLAAVVFVESRFNHASVSPAGARGLGQLMPDTAAGLGVDPRDPLQNLLGAAWLLRLNLGEFQTLPLALAAYNAGGTAVRRWEGIPPYAETQWYVWAVLWVYDGLKG